MNGLRNASRSQESHLSSWNNNVKSVANGKWSTSDSDWNSWGRWIYLVKKNTLKIVFGIASEESTSWDSEWESWRLDNRCMGNEAGEECSGETCLKWFTCYKLFMYVLAPPPWGRYNVVGTYPLSTRPLFKGFVQPNHNNGCWQLFAATAWLPNKMNIT